MLELLALLLGVILAALRSRRDLVLENLLLRHRLAGAARPKRRPRLRSWDKVLWLLGRRLCADWRRHLALVTPDTVVRWHREGWRRRRHDLEARIEALARQARELEVEATRRVDLTQAISHVEVFCRRVREGLAAATFEEKRQLVELLIDRVVVTDEQVEIRYGVPTSSGGEQTRFVNSWSGVRFPPPAPTLNGRCPLDSGRPEPGGPSC